MLITPIISPPITTPNIFPFPPKKLVPPIIAAAIANVSKPAPACGSADPTLAVETTPAIPAQTPEIIKTISVCNFTFIPENHAAWLFPPMHKCFFQA